MTGGRCFLCGGPSFEGYSHPYRDRLPSSGSTIIEADAPWIMYRYRPYRCDECERTTFDGATLFNTPAPWDKGDE